MIKKISKDKYKIVVENGRVDGKRARISRTVNGTKQEAKLLEVELMRDCQKGLNQKKMTLSEFANKFIEDYCKPNLKENTTFGYTVLLKVILKELGTLRIDKISPYDLQKYYNKLTVEYAYSSNTVAHHYTLINLMLRKAVIWRFIKDNPNTVIEKPKTQKKEAKVYDYSDVSKLLNALKEEQITYRTMITLALDSGMRREEINGLMWKDINFTTGEVMIERVRLIVNNREVIENPKTSNSKRKIIITMETLKLLKNLREYQQENSRLLKNLWCNTDFVFVNQEGKPFYPDTPSKILQKILKRHELKKITFHQLRHTSATLLINSNADITSVSARLGHSNTSTTLNIYSHTLERSKKEMADKMSAILKSV